MARSRKLAPNAYLVDSLRFHGGMPQEELGKASRVSQAEISKYGHP
jgi:hypothetical protein